MKRDDPRHGSYAGWAAHAKDKKRPCRPCMDARNAYQREWAAKKATPKPRSKCSECNKRTRQGATICADCNEEIAIPATLRKVQDGYIVRWVKAS